MAKTSYIGAVDQGTTSSRFMVFDTAGRIVALHQIEFAQIYPHAGWAEHDPMEILDTVRECIDKTVEKMKQMDLDPTAIKAIGITNQRETAVVWDAETGLPLHNAIVWHDARTKNTVAQLVQKTPTKKTDYFQGITGLPLSTYFSAIKLRWMLDHSEQVRQAHSDGRLRFGTVDSWLIYHLTGGKRGGVHVTDVTNASRTMLLDLKTLKWSDEMIEFFGIDKACLPEIKSSSEVYGEMVDGALKGLPIAGCLGDQQAALVGQKCFDVGAAKNTYGTGCFMLFNTGTQPVMSGHGLLTTVGYHLPALNKDPVYALEGSIAVGGQSIKFLRDNLNIISSSEEINTLAGQVTDSGGVFFVPAFSGLFAPHWRDDARGCFVGLTSYSDKRHIARSVLECIGYQTRDILIAMNKDAKQPLKVLKVDGGVTNSDLCMSIQANIAGITVERPAVRETTALGAAIAAGLATGIFKSAEDLAAFNSEGVDRFEPNQSEEVRERSYRKWKKAVEKSIGWVDEDDAQP
ncbi:Glycerol kinase [Sorochytrium milnesiophthora]